MEKYSDALRRLADTLDDDFAANLPEVIAEICRLAARMAMELRHILDADGWWPITITLM